MSWQSIETVPEHCAVLIFTRNRGIKIERAEHVRRLIEEAKLHGEECFYTHWTHLPDDPESGITPGGIARDSTPPNTQGGPE